jgi:hypothetical protein
MLRTILLFAIALTIALGGGAASVWLALESFAGVGRVSVGNWTATPLEGTNRADPYTKARFSRGGELALGLAEGIRFVAHTDSAAAPLRRDCTYLVRGVTPPTRFWTLYAAASPGDTRPVSDRPATVSSRTILRNPDDSFSIAFGPHPVPGNWRSVRGSGPMVLVLTLYDTPVANQASLADIAMPEIVRQACE